jgi:chromosome segregation ATPase
MNTLKIINTNDNVEMVIVQLLEYNRLKQENIDLHNKLNLLTNESTKLNADLLSKNLELEILRKENQELREKIKILEEKITIQDKNINELKENSTNKDIRIDVLEKEIINKDIRITNIEKENNTLKLDIKELKEDNINRNNKDLLKKIIIGIQDLNALEKLETKVADSYELMNLRNDRVDDCHYINSNYSQLEKDIRINILIDNINNASENIINKFDTLYPNLLNELKPFLIKKDINYNQRIFDRANNWWSL